MTGYIDGSEWCSSKLPCANRTRLEATVADLLEELEQQADGTSVIIALLAGQSGPVAASLVGMLQFQEANARAAITKATPEDRS